MPARNRTIEKEVQTGHLPGKWTSNKISQLPDTSPWPLARRDTGLIPSKWPFRLRHTIPNANGYVRRREWVGPILIKEKRKVKKRFCVCYYWVWAATTRNCTVAFCRVVLSWSARPNRDLKAGSNRVHWSGCFDHTTFWHAHWIAQVLWQDYAEPQRSSSSDLRISRAGPAISLKRRIFWLWKLGTKLFVKGGGWELPKKKKRWRLKANFKLNIRKNKHTFLLDFQ